MRGIADDLGVTPMALYHHVRDRKDLGHLRDQPPGGADRDAAAALALVEHYATWVATHPDRAHPRDPGTEWSPLWDDD